MNQPNFSALVAQTARDTHLVLQVTPEQEKALYGIAEEKKDTLLVLPTGSGKSLVFQLLPRVLSSISIPDPWVIPAAPIVILVCPLVSLMEFHGG